MKNVLKKLFIALNLISLVSCGTNTSSSESSISSNVSNDYEVIDKSVSNVTTKDGSKVQPFNTIVTLRTFSQKDHND